ncbi:hypothetical protein, partial [Rhizobium rhizogenes]|uniref:hypothetical protein n=1 Tax=Rhizobium rhizogenes TaxID=359 RepID=UPI001AEEFC19
GKHLSSLTERGQPECSVPVHANRCSAGNQRDALPLPHGCAICLSFSLKSEASFMNAQVF